MYFRDTSYCHGIDSFVNEYIYLFLLLSNISPCYAIHFRIDPFTSHTQARVQRVYIFFTIVESKV